MMVTTSKLKIPRHETKPPPSECVTVSQNFFEQARQKGVLTRQDVPLGPFQGINGCWKDCDCIVFGSAWTGEGIDLRAVERSGIKTITTNHYIEKWDRSDFHVFQDHRFVKMTTYKFKKYKGKIFTANTCIFNLDRKFNNVVRFLPLLKPEFPTEKIEDGLYSRSLTGLIAVNLAIVTGAKRIFLVGLDSPQDTNDLKIKSGNIFGYTGAEPDVQKSFEGIKNKMVEAEKFKPWANRLYTIVKNGYYDYANYISLEDLNSMLVERGEE